MAGGAGIGSMAFGQVGTAFSAAGALQSATTQAQNDYINADLATKAAQQADTQAGIERQQSFLKAGLAERMGANTLGSIRASFGASGVTNDSEHDVVENQRALTALNVTQIKYQGFLSANSYSAEAQKLRIESSAYRKAGDSATQAGLYNALGTAFGGLGGELNNSVRMTRAS